MNFNKLSSVIIWIHIYYSYGIYILTGSLDNTAKIWDIVSSTVIHSYLRNEPVTAVQTSKCGRFNMILSNDRKADIIDTQDTKDHINKALHDFKYMSITAMTLSNCGRYSIMSYDDNLTVIWNNYTRKSIKIFNDHRDSVTSIAVSNDMQYVITGSKDNTAILYNTDSFLHKPNQDLNQYDFLYRDSDIYRKFNFDSPVSSVAISPCNSFIVISTIKGKAVVYNTKIHNYNYRLIDQESGITSVAINDKYIITGGVDGVAKLYDYKNKRLIQEFIQDSMITSLALSNEGFAVTGGVDRIARLYDIETGKLVRSFIGHQDSISSIAISNCIGK